MEVLLIILFSLGIASLLGIQFQGRRYKPNKNVIKFFTVLMYACAILFLMFLSLLIMAQ